MLRFASPFLLWLAVCQAALGGYKIDGPAVSAPYKIVRLKLTEDGKEPEKDTQVIWKLRGYDGTGKPLDADLDKSGYGLWFTGPPGVYKVEATIVNFTSRKLDSLEYTVTIGDPGPGPGPDPGPGPKPPPPTPVDPSPIPLPGFRVLILYETAEASTMPSAQRAIIGAKKIRDYLESKCVVGDDDKTKEYRIWDKDVDPSTDAAHWADAVKSILAKKAKKDELLKLQGKPVGANFVPTILISTGTTGYVGPLPANVDETLALLKKYGG